MSTNTITVRYTPDGSCCRTTCPHFAAPAEGIPAACRLFRVYLFRADSDKPERCLQCCYARMDEEY